MDNPVEISTADGVQTIRFNRPDKKNAITSDMYKRISDALQAGDADEEIRVHLFLGSQGAFTAGNDIGDFIRFAEDGAIGDHVLVFLKTLAGVKKPMVAGVDGLAIGIGTTMLLHCDLAYASRRSLFRTPFTDLGLVPEAASSLLAPHLMGHVRAFELLVSGKPFSAEDALNAGLVNAVLDDDALEGAALKAATELAGKPPEAVAIARQLMRGDPAEIVSRIEEEIGYFADRLKSAEAKAAFSDFMNREKN